MRFSPSGKGSIVADRYGGREGKYGFYLGVLLGYFFFVIVAFITSIAIIELSGTH